ncbi:MAG: hypothetical protein ACYSU1_06990, partial [Planctomycetota bacterium]
MNTQKLVFLLLLLAGCVVAYFALREDGKGLEAGSDGGVGAAFRRETLTTSDHSTDAEGPTEPALAAEAADADRLQAIDLNRNALASLEKGEPEQAV